VIDASVGLKWVLQESDSHLALTARIHGDPVVPRVLMHVIEWAAASGIAR
jgi:hypothetical protein